MNKTYHNSFIAMGTRLNVIFINDDHKMCEREYEIIRNEVLRIESLLNYFDRNSEVYNINHSKPGTIIPLSDELFEIFSTCDEYFLLTNAAFDITMRTMIEHYGNYDSKKSQSKEKYSFSKNILLDKKSKTISINHENTKVDFGGFGKGYALEKIKQHLFSCPIKCAFISFGESSILVKGNHPSGKEWSVGIKNLYESEKSVCSFNLESGYSVSTSSNFFTDDDGEIKKKINVINPYTLEPVNDITVVSVKSEFPVEAEILSTAFLVLDDKYIFDIVNNLKNIEVVKVFYDNKVPLIKKYNWKI